MTVRGTETAYGDASGGRILVGRDGELRQIAGALDDVGRGRGRLVLLAGEPGIGKTSVADWTTAEAARRGMGTVWGRCWEAGGAPAYWPWLEVLAHVAGGLDDAALRRALGEGAPLVADLSPEIRARLGDLVPTAAPPADEARFRLWRAIAGLLRCEGDARPLLVVLEDLHAADRASLSLLHFVSRELRPMRLLLLATYRDVEARMDAETSDQVARIGREGLTLTLPRLDRATSSTFVRQSAGDVDDAVAARIVESTGGNPLFLHEMIRLLGDEGAESILAGVVPNGVRDVIRQRLQRVGAQTRSLLDLAAVAGDEIDVPLLAQASGEGAATVATRLGEAARAGIVVERAGRRRFVHALFREVLYREQEELPRRERHGRIAEALQRLHAHLPPHAELAHHALEGPPAMLERAVDHAVAAAARSGELSAYDEAVRTLVRACEAVEAAGNPPALRGRLLVATAEARIRAGDTSMGQEHCREAFAIGRALGDAELLARAALTHGRVFTFGWSDQKLVDMLQEALAALPPGDTPLRARLLARLGGAMQPRPQLESAILVAREAIATARRLGDPHTLLATLHDALSAMMECSPPVEQRDLNLEAEALALALGDRERLLRTHGRLATAHMALGELAAADAAIDAFERLAAELKAPWSGWRAGMLRAIRATMQGRFAEAERLAQEAAAMAVGRDATVQVITVSRQESLMRAWERHEDMAAFDAMAKLSRVAYTQGIAWQAASEALTFARLEDEERARQGLVALTPYGDAPADNLFALFFVADAAALTGATDLVRRLYDRMLALPDEYVMLGMSYMSWEGPKARQLGILAAALGRWDEAWQHFADAIARCRRLGALPYLARIEYEYARALLARGAAGDVERARPLLDSARATAERLGMTGLVRLIDRRLSPGAAPAPPAAVAPPLTAGLPFAFVLEGEYWAFTHEGVTFRLKDSVGLQYLARLFAEPGRELHVLDLAVERAGAGATEVVDAGDAGELLDDEARERYRRRMEDLRDAVAEAESIGDAARADRARTELEFLASEVSRAVGLGGRARRAGAAAERARSAVQRRIKSALERIGDHAPALAAYLSRTVRTGNYCVYRP